MKFEYDAKTIKARINALFEQRGIKAYKVMPELGLATRTTDPSNVSMPKADTLAKIADYLDVSVDELLGRDPAPYYDALGKLSADEVLLLLAYRDMSDADRASLLDIAQLYQSRNASEKVSREEYA